MESFFFTIIKLKIKKLNEKFKFSSMLVTVSIVVRLNQLNCG